MTDEDVKLEIPKAIKSKLPGYRGEIERLKAFLKQTEGEIAKLEAGRATLVGEIEKLVVAKHAAEGSVVVEAASIVDRIKSGMGWNPPAPKARTIVDDSDLRSGRMALEQLDAEIGGMRLRLDRIDNAIGEAVRAYLREEHTARRERYAALREEMRQLLAEMNAVASFAGVGKFPAVFDVPDQNGSLLPLRVDENHVSKISAEWKKLADALRDHPSRLPTLKFPAHDPKGVKQLVYHEMTRSERKLIDDSAGAANVTTGINSASLGVHQ